jgi:hypothetical protein
VSTNAHCTFNITEWNEDPYQQLDGGAKLTRARVSQSYQGGITGIGVVDFIMFHRADGTARFAGMELITAAVAGRSAAFIIQHAGTYDYNGACRFWPIVSGSGTDGLTGIFGAGSYTTTSKSVPVSFNYSFTGN